MEIFSNIFSQNFTKARFVNKLYELTTKHRIVWEDIGEVNYGRYSPSTSDQKFQDHKWVSTNNRFSCDLYRTYIGNGQDRIEIKLSGNPATSVITSEEINGIYVINPISAIIQYLISEKDDKAGQNCSYENLIDFLNEI